MNEATYNIGNKTVDGITVVNGTLIVTGSENIFNAISPTQVQCDTSQYKVLVYYDCK